MRNIINDTDQGTSDVVFGCSQSNIASSYFKEKLSLN